MSCCRSSALGKDDFDGGDEVGVALERIAGAELVCKPCCGVVVFDVSVPVPEIDRELIFCAKIRRKSLQARLIADEGLFKLVKARRKRQV